MCEVGCELSELVFVDSAVSFEFIESFEFTDVNSAVSNEFEESTFVQY